MNWAIFELIFLHIVCSNNTIFDGNDVIDASKVRYENGRVIVTLDSLSPIGFLTTPIVKVAEDNAAKIENAAAKAVQDAILDLDSKIKAAKDKADVAKDKKETAAKKTTAAAKKA